MPPGIILIFYRLPLSMAARERISNENNVYFILLSIPRANQSVKKIVLKARWSVTVFTNFAKQILSRMV